MILLRQLLLLPIEHRLPLLGFAAVLGLTSPSVAGVACFRALLFLDFLTGSAQCTMLLHLPPS